MKWMTGPALKVLIELGGLQVGDQIKYGVCPIDEEHSPIHDSSEERAYMGKVMEIVKIDDHEHWPLELARPGGPRIWCACPCSITHWRRPK